ncbi:MAG TPA: prolipoprotein diacylglyceryl transferase [Rectinemataceae bacterium]|nr:prolipoprotein diacylglyceryl transferase [Rectinemataceae bacterium]
MVAMLQFPAWLRPEIIPGLPFRWYGLMYVLAFGTAWYLFRYESKRLGKPWSEELAANFFLWAIVGVLIGGRLAGTLIYNPTDYYWRRPWFILWPFDETGRFVGYQGMSFHGGLVGVIAASLVWCKAHKEKWFAWADIIAMAAPLGYTFGRLGNFINGELWGKVTAAPWGMVFPYAEQFSARESWVQEIAGKAGITLSSMNDVVNLPRHPSQLYEAIFEGLALWLFMWLIVRKRRPFEGFVVGAYVIGYGLIRFVIEYFREPDAGLGYIIKLGNPDAPTYTLTTLFNFSMGQILCFLMIAGGMVFLNLRRRRSERDIEEAQRATNKISARKLRKRIK